MLLTLTSEHCTAQLVSWLAQLGTVGAQLYLGTAYFGTVPAVAWFMDTVALYVGTVSRLRLYRGSIHLVYETKAPNSDRCSESITLIYNDSIERNA